MLASPMTDIQKILWLIMGDALRIHRVSHPRADSIYNFMQRELVLPNLVPDLLRAVDSIHVQVWAEAAKSFHGQSMPWTQRWRPLWGPSVVQGHVGVLDSTVKDKNFFFFLDTSPAAHNRKTPFPQALTQGWGAPRAKGMWHLTDILSLPQGLPCLLKENVHSDSGLTCFKQQHQVFQVHSHL